MLRLKDGAMRNLNRMTKFVAGIIILCTCVCLQVHATTYVTITKEMQVVDSFHGVDAVYHPNAADGTDTTYSCAAYVKRYYNTVTHACETRVFPL